MLKFIARRRLNYIDVFGLSIASAAFRDGYYTAMAVILVVGTVASIFAERRAGFTS